ncbi:MAG: family 20 glycosylhydrolase [Phycisphaerae bacterium]|nr:family 20 glycosylhydrolase [Phycisphaerae bacterium]
MCIKKSGLLPIIAACLVCVTGVHASPVSVIPKPVKMQVNEGSFAFDAGTAVVSPSTLMSQAHLLSTQLARATGFGVPVKDAIEAGGRTIQLHLEESQRLGKEGYHLQVTPEQISIRAQTQAGIFYGCQTLKQLCDPGIYASQPLADRQWLIPCVDITDYPAYPWRGMMLDVSRYFLDKEFVLRYLDIMALHKLNVLQLHLNDDCGWRVEIKAYPELTTQGAFRGKGAERVGGFYSQEDVREMVRYAAQRNITIVPELELPAHALAALVAYPYLGCTGKAHEMPTKHFISKDLYCPGKDTTWTFLEGVFQEIITLFPSEYIHIGGDEASYDRWKECPDCLAKMKALGIEPGHEYELQGWMNLRMEKFMLAHHRRIIGWDEILKCGVTPQAAIMTWHRPETSVQGAKRGNGVVMALTGHCYFDTPESKLPGELPGAGWLAPITLEKAYDWEPRPEGLSDIEARNILGAQGCVWTDMFLHQPWLADVPVLGERRSELYVEYFSLPRMAALAEVVWTPRGQRHWEDFQLRMRRQYTRYTNSQFNFRVPVPKVMVRGPGSPWVVTVENPVEGGQVHYTVDGTFPTVYSPTYQGPVTVEARDAFRAMTAAADGKHRSLVYESTSGSTR